MFSAFIGNAKGTGDGDSILHVPTEKPIVAPEQASNQLESNRHVQSPSGFMQVRKPKMVVDVPMPNSASVADLVLQLQEDERDENLLSMDLPPERVEVSSPASSEEHCSPTLTEQGIVPTGAEDVSEHGADQLVDRDAGPESLPDTSTLKAVEGVRSEPQSTATAKAHEPSGKPVPSESTKTVAADVPDPYSFAGVVESSAAMEPNAKVSTELPVAFPWNPSPRKQRRPSKVATEVNPLIALPRFDGRLRAGLNVCVESIGRERERDKLIILNVHGILVDCSLDQEKNPNSKVRPTVRTRTRRIFFRPWLVPFLSRCFLHFSVAFWGSKSKSYMDDIIPAMMERQKTGPHFCPLFVWAGKDCEATDYEGTTPIAWGKPLKKVYSMWPRFSPSNTLVIESKLCRVACNPPANVVLSKPFYLAQMTKLADDNNYLKDILWPMLQQLADSEDISHFRSRCRASVHMKEPSDHQICDDEASIDDLVTVEGEGTCEP